MKLLFLPLLLLLLHPDQFQAQNSIPFNPAAEIQFKQAVANFEHQNYIAAAAMFEQVEKDFPLHQRTTAAIIMHAKSLFHLGSYESAIRELDDFLSRFPQSMYREDAHFMIGQDRFVLHQYAEVVPEMLSVIEHSNDTVTINHAETLLNITAVNHLPVDQLSVVYSGAVTQPAVTAIGRAYAQKLAREGEFTKAVGVLREIIARYPADRHAGDLKTLLSIYEKGTRIKFGILLPLLTGVPAAPGQEIAADLLDGIKYAVEEFNNSSTVRIAVDVRDTQRDLTLIPREIDSLAADPEVLAVLGPVFSDESEAAAREAVRRALPMVSPTATADGLTSAGNEIFQANPDYTIRGTLMAQFAVRNLGLKHLAVLNSAEAFSTRMAQAFIKEAVRLGASVEAHEHYERGAGDLQQQMSAIRTAGLHLEYQPIVIFSSELKKNDIQKLVRTGLSRSFVDSLIDRNARVSAGALLGPDWKTLIDSLRIPVLQQRVDTIGLQTPATGIEAVYAPIASPDEIGVIGAQFAYNNIRTQLLGSGDWYRVDELDANNRYINGVYFDTDCYLTRDERSYVNFVEDYRRATGKQASKNVVLGYDTMKMMLSVIRGKKIERDEFRRRLAELQNYVSLHSIIAFTPHRVNGALTILQYKDGRITEIAHELWNGEAGDAAR